MTAAAAPAAALALALVLGGCTDGVPSTATVGATSAPAPTWVGLASDDPVLARLLGPWTTTPIALSPELLAEVDRVCRATHHDLTTLDLVVADARGRGLVHAFYVTTGEFATTNCLDMEFDPAGRVDAKGFGSSDPTPLPAVAADDLIVRHRTSEEAPRSIDHIAGLVGSDIATVRLTSAHDPDVVATMANGWFAAWFPSDHFTSLITLRGYDASGKEVAAVAP